MEVWVQGLGADHLSGEDSQALGSHLTSQAENPSAAGTARERMSFPRLSSWGDGLEPFKQKARCPLEGSSRMGSLDGMARHPQASGSAAVDT